MNRKLVTICILFLISILMSGCSSNDTLQQHVDETKCMLDNASMQEKNAILTDILQVTDGEVSLEDMIDGVSVSRRLILLIPAIILLILVVRLVYSYVYREQGQIKLRVYAAITLVSGWALYYVGFFFGGTAASCLAFFVRPLLAAMGMFVGSTGYQEISEDCANSPLYMSAFAIIHFAAITVSAVFVINFFWKRLKSYIQGVLWYVFPSSTPLNVFFGFNEQSILLAKNIHETKNGQEHIVFIDMPTDYSEEQKELSLSNLFGFSSYQHNSLEQLKGVSYALKNSFGRLSDIESKDGEVLKALHLRQIKKLILRYKHTRIFFLSNNEDENIKSVLNLMKDNVCKSNKIDIFCHARKNRENSVVEKMAYVENETNFPNVHLIDSANLSVQLLKTDVANQPISFVNPDIAKGVVNEQFTALVLGFGETGRDAVRFLYEFGAFPDSNGMKSPFKCYVIDKQMDALAGGFYNTAPALRGNKELELLMMDEKSEEFWQWIDAHISQINYIVLALGSDNLNMQIAVDLLEKALQKDRSNNHFRIFIRSYLKENESRMTEMVDFYNKKVGETFVVFGKSQEIYTYQNVIDEEALQQAKEFYSGYTSKKSNDPTWEQRHIICDKIIQGEKTIYQEKARKDVTLDDINAVIRKENQDLANSYHIGTKLTLVGLSRESSEDEFEKLTDEQKMNLAICEHLRWNASHEMIGYVYGEKDDNLRKTHSCLKPWQELSEEYQGYDYQVMERTKDVVLNRQK